MKIAKAALYVVKFILCAITLFGAYGCLYGAQALAWPWPWKNLTSNFLVAFQTQFPIFMFGLIHPDAPIKLRVASLLLILSFLIAALALYRIQAKGTRSFVILLLLLTTSYALYLWAKGFDVQTLQVVASYMGVLFFFAFLGRLLHKSSSVSERFDKG
jgi:hypothetical protein